MKTKNQFTNRILSLVLALVMVVGLMPMTSFAAETVRVVASEAPTWDELGSITYTDGATQYLLYENRLYKIAYTNIKDSTRIAFIRVGSGESKILAISYNGLGFLYQANNYQARTEHMPKTPGESLECYPDSATAGYIVEKDKPVVIITCMAVGDPTWTWNGTSSATATFTSTDGNAQMTVNVTVTSSTQTAESCLEKNQITYTATATANGKQYTTTKTVDGEQGPHSYAYSSLGNTVTESCTNCSNHTATATLNADGAYIYTGSAITPATITYSDNWQGEKPTDISYVNNVDVGTATATITVEGQTLTKNFQIKNAYSVSFNANGGSGAKGSETIADGEEYTLPTNPFTAPSGYQFKGWATSQNGNVLQDEKIIVSENVTLYAIWEKIPAEMPTVAVSENLTLTYGEYTGQKFTATVEKKDGYTYKYQWIDGNTVISNTDTLEIPDDLAAGVYDYYLAVGAKRTDNGEITWYTNRNLLVKVNPKELDASNITLNQDTFTYDGKEQIPTVTVKVGGKTLTEYTDYDVILPSDCKNAGTKIIKVFFRGNYSGSAQVDYEIKQKEIGIYWGAPEFIPYTGELIVPQATATGLADGDVCTLTTSVVETTEGAGIVPGRWHAKVTSLSNDNYCLPASGNLVEVEYGIVKGYIAAPVVSGIDETIKGKADGKINGLTTEMEYVTEYTADDDKYTKVTDANMTFAPGTYYVRYQAAGYYNASSFTTVVIKEGGLLRVTIPQTQTGYTIATEDTELVWNGSTTLSFTLKEGYSKTGAFAVKVNETPIALDANDQYVITNAQEDIEITVEGVADITPPTAEIKVKENKWTSFWNNLTFGFFFKETQDVTITANDAGTVVKTVQYYLSDRELERDEVRAITDWVDYNGTFKMNPDYKYVVYAKVADNDGNVAYINSAGIVLYSDSTLDTTIKDKITYVLTKNAEQAFTLNLNGNTVAYVKIDNIVLGNEDYEVLGNMVFISDEVLENLSAGEYTVTVGINPMGETFVDGDAPAEIAIPLFVEKAVVAIDISDFDKVYDGTPASAEYKISKSSDSSPAASNIVYNEKVEYKAYGADDSTYTETAPVNAGKYTVRITVAETDKITSATETADFTIAKANYNMKGAKWNYTAPFQYDGKVHKVEVVGLPTGVTVESYENNTATTVGDYYAEVNLAYDANNYNAPTINKLGWTIYNDWTPAEYTVTAQNANGWLNENFFIKANEGYLVSFSDNADDFRSDSLACMTQEENIEITFYLQNIRTGAISLGKTVVCSIDKTVPTGKVEFVNRTGWEEFLNTITFNLFYKDEVTIKVTADDNLSGIDKIEYASFDKAMTLDEVKAITNWTEYTDSFGVTLEDAKKFVYFVRITDKAGNVTYLSTDGAEYDTKAPVIEGIENGKTYYTTQKVTVTDKNIDSITLNGDTAGNEITLEGNKVAIYTIIATDKAGNSTTVTVMMKPISDLSAPIDTLTKDNVNSSNEGVVDEVKADVAAVDTTNATDAEKQALKDIADKAAELKKVIDDTVAENDRISDAVDGYDLATVTSDDKDDLEQLLADIEKQLASTNLTEEEVSELNGDKKAVQDLLDTIEDAKKALDDAKAALAELNKPAEPHSPATGDNSNIWLWFVLLFVSGTGVFGITLYDRKRKVANKR